MELFFCGTRGSMPSPGAHFVRYGGQTSCLAIAHDAGRPTLVLDGGSGLCNLDNLLGNDPFRGTILLGHLHWDHTHGLPFFRGGQRHGHEVKVLVPDQGESAESLLGRAFSPPHFPIEPHELGEGWSFANLEEGEHHIEGFDVLVLEIPHKGGRTFGIRVSDGTSVLAYLSDHHPLALGPGPRGLGELHPAALELARDCDLLIHDAQLLTAELPRLARFGHSCGEYAVSLAEAAGARKVCLFHHAPTRVDDDVEAIGNAFQSSSLPVVVAFDGLQLTLGRGLDDNDDVVPILTEPSSPG